MRSPVQITFRNMDRSPAVEASVRELAERLDHFFDDIMGCRVVVESDHRHHHKGNLYHVRVDLTVPDAELVVSREPEAHQAHEDIYVAIHDAFGSIRRQLEDYARKRRGDVKHHDLPLQGHVREVMPAANWGVIEGQDGREVRFARGSVSNEAFDALEPGDAVRFIAGQDEAGNRVATRVHLVGKRH